MIRIIKRYINNKFRRFVADQLPPTSFYEELRKAVQAQAGRIKILEEQQEIMHNFLVEINKYLIAFADKNQREIEMGYQSMGDKHGSKSKSSGKHEGRVEKAAERRLKDKKMHNEFKPHKGMK
jgi:hypothetical protein